MWKKIYKRERGNGVVYLKKTVKVDKIIKLRHRYRDAFVWNKEAEEKNSLKEGKTNER